jgi:hypothetical protein
MSLRSLRTPVVLCSLALAGCGVGSRILGSAGTQEQATARFVNGTATPLDLATSGVVTTANGNIAPGATVACFGLTDLVTPGLSVRQTGTTTDLAGFSPRFSPGGHYTLVSFPSASGGIQFATVPTATVPNAGRSALRLFNASPAIATADLYVTAPGAALGAPRETGILFGTASGSFDVAAGIVQVRLVSAGPVVTDLGSFALVPDQSYTIIYSSATPRFLVPDC